jgi:hypothetical protein
MVDVFISYVEEDGDQAVHIAEGLESAGFERVPPVVEKGGGSSVSVRRTASGSQRAAA